jgi:hypothetical protein
LVHLSYVQIVSSPHFPLHVLPPQSNYLSMREIDFKPYNTAGRIIALYTHLALTICTKMKHWGLNNRIHFALKKITLFLVHTKRVKICAF